MNSTFTSHCASLIFTFVFFCTSHALAGDTDPPNQLNSVVSQDVLESKIEEVNSSTNLDEETRNKLVEQYRKTITFLEQSSSFISDTDQYISIRKTAPEELEVLNNKFEKLQTLSAEEIPNITDKTPLSDIEQLLQKEKANLTAVEAKLSENQLNLKSQKNRPSEARDRLILAGQELKQTRDELKLIEDSPDEDNISESQLWLLQAQALSLRNEIKMLDQELLSNSAIIKLLEAQQKIAEFDVEFVSTRTRLLEEIVTERRVAEASLVQQQAEAVMESLQTEHPAVRELAENNVALGEAIRERAEQLEQLSEEQNKTQATAKLISKNLESARQKLELAGMSQVIGRVLLEQSRGLPDISDLRKQSLQLEQDISKSGLLQIQYKEDLRKLRKNKQAYIDNFTKSVTASEADKLQAELEQLADSRAALLTTAIETENKYLLVLGEFDLAISQLIFIIRDFKKFIGKRLLWIKTSNPISFTQLLKLPSEIASLLSISNWLEVFKAFFTQLTANPTMLFSGIVLVILVGYRGLFIRKLVATGNNIGHISTDRYSYTLLAFSWTVLASISIPLLLLFCGWQLSLADSATAFGDGVASGLLRSGRDLFALSLFANVCLADGLAVKHFRWPEKEVAKTREVLIKFIFIFVPSVFLANVVANGSDSGLDSASFILLALITFLAIIFLPIRLFAPGGGVLSSYIQQNSTNIFTRYYKFWLGLHVIIFAFLLLMIFIGYSFTGAILARSFVNILFLISLLIIFNALVFRGISLIGRRVAYQAHLQKNEQATGDEGTFDVDEPEIDFASLGTDSRKLLKTAMFVIGLVSLWFILTPVLPALSILEDITLWQQTKLVDSDLQVVPVTLADVLLAIVIAIATFGIARGLPATIEILLLQRSAISAGNRYTIITMLRYVVFGVGAVLFFGVLGGTWSQIQWLVAALSVGIGFGLQEIVANFISGLIILFERPIRIGDTVTVGDTSGVVTKIQIRATTITNWDKQELLVPNKEFITGRLLNWSLTDPMTRVVIPVGVPHGSDVNKALEIMQQAAEEHELILSDPAPILTFEKFGDHSLHLTLRAYLPSIEYRLRTITELHKTIHSRFNEAGIELALPSRDIHINADKPLNVRLHDEKGSKE